MWDGVSSRPDGPGTSSGASMETPVEALNLVIELLDETHAPVALAMAGTRARSEA